MKKRRHPVRKGILWAALTVAATLALLYFARNADFNSGNPDHASIQTPTTETTGDLVLVNRWNELPQNYTVNLITLDNGEQVAEEILPHLQQMFDEMRAQGLSPIVNSGYRTEETQRQLLEEETAEQQANGLSFEDAQQEAEKWVAPPGTSEHHTGLAVDISMTDDQDVWGWLSENAHRYGFHLRYTEEKQAITGIRPEPWHYRYVGEEIAKELYEKGLCLEEYTGESSR